MKKQMPLSLRNVTRKLIVPALFSALFLNFIPDSLHAQNTSPSSEKPVVKYVGKINDDLLFQVDLDNSKEDVYSLTINDEAGNTLYSDRFKERRL